MQARLFSQSHQASILPVSSEANRKQPSQQRVRLSMLSEYKKCLRAPAKRQNHTGIQMDFRNFP